MNGNIRRPKAHVCLNITKKNVSISHETVYERTTKVPLCVVLFDKDWK